MKNRSRRRMHHGHLRNPIIWMGLIITPFLALLLWDDVENLIENFQSKKKVADKVINLPATQEPLYVEDVNGAMENMHHLTGEGKDVRSWHRVYPYSVVSGGVHSVQELRSAIGRDPVVAKHYSNFKLDNARVVEAKADRDFHVSYRIGEEIFWTKKRLRVAKGERLISDGTNFTRTRCANMVSEVPPGKTSPDEPPPEAFDTQMVPPWEPTPSPPPVVIEGGPPDPPGEPAPFLPPVVTGTWPPDPPGEPVPFLPPVVTGGEPSGPVPVPEPATILLLCLGLMGLAGYGRKKFSKK